METSMSIEEVLTGISILLEKEKLTPQRSK